jgi:hypothetical protein
VLSRNPLCVECERQGRITPATVVDHIIPHKGNLELFWDEDNLQALCKPCHDRKTAKEGRWGEKARFTLTDPGVGGYQSLQLLAPGAAAGLRVRFREIQGGGSKGLKPYSTRFLLFKKQLEISGQRRWPFWRLSVSR